MATERPQPPIDPELSDVEIDIRTAHAARVYDYLLGGRTNFAVDRVSADAGFATYPGGVDAARHDARANREFMRRTIRYLVNEVGLRHFLDLGTGIPAPSNAHGVAQTANPECRIVYVDNDPIVLSHAHRLLRSTPEGKTDYIWGDFRTPEKILRRARDTIDLRQPVGLLMIGLLHLIPDNYQPCQLIGEFLDALPSGSHVVISQISTDIDIDGITTANDLLDSAMGTWNPVTFRPTSEIQRFFDGLELTEEGLVPVKEWRPDDGVPHGFEGRATPLIGGVARKP